MSILPEEVLIRIFSYLDSDDCEELRSCALAGSPMVYPSRQNIPMFKDIWAHDSLSLFKLRECTKSKYSTVRHHILSISITDDSEGESLDFSKELDVTDILSACRNIVRLDLQYIYIRPFELTTMKNLTYLRLADISIYSPMHVVALLGHFPNIEIVKLCRMSFCDAQVPSGSLPRSLRFLEIRLNVWVISGNAHTDQLLDWMASTSSELPPLARFAVYDVGVADVHVLLVVLRRLANCVQSVTIQEGRRRAETCFVEGNQDVLEYLAWYRDSRGTDKFRLDAMTGV